MLRRAGGGAPAATDDVTARDAIMGAAQRQSHRRSGAALRVQARGVRAYRPLWWNVCGRSARGARQCCNRVVNSKFCDASTCARQRHARVRRRLRARGACCQSTRLRARSTHTRAAARPHGGSKVVMGQARRRRQLGERGRARRAVRTCPAGTSASSGGTMTTMPASRAAGVAQMASRYDSGDANSSTVGRNTGASGSAVDDAMAAGTRGAASGAAPGRRGGQKRQASHLRCDTRAALSSLQCARHGGASGARRGRRSGGRRARR